MATAITPYDQTNNNLFVPTQISGLSLWLDAADSSTVITSGSSVSQWNDKSGNGKNMISNATFQRPIYSANSLNGNNSILFFRNASNSFSILENTSFNFVTASWTYFTILRRNAANTTFQRFLSMASVINGGDNNNAASLNLNSTSLNNSFNMERSGGSLAGTFNTSNVCLLENIVNGSGTNIDTINANTNYLFANGSQLTSGGGLSVGTNLNIAHIRYGCTTSKSGTNDSGVESLQGNIGEVLLFNRTLRRSEIQQIEGYLAWKWGIQRSLPVTHPYYNNAYLSNSYPITYFPSRLNPTTIFPNQIPNLALWLDAADARTVITSGPNVTQWNDKSDNRYIATGFSNPLYVNNAVNNLSAVRFNGTSSYFSIPGNQLDLTTEDFAIFAVVQYTPRAAQIPIIGKAVGASATLQWRLSFDPNNIFQIVVFKNSVVISSTSTYTTAGWTLFSGVVYRSTSIQGFINATGLNTGGTVAGTLSDTSVNVEIGRGWSGSHFFNSDMGEILLYKGTVTVNQRQAIEGYLMYKWGIKNSLPPTHPFYTPPILPATPISIRQYVWQPTGMALWLDAADSSRMTVIGSNITQYVDKSSNQIVLSNTTSANQPNLVVDSNNMPNILFNGTSQHLVNSTVAASNLTLNNELTIFFVHSPTNATNSLICWTNFTNQLSRINFHTPEGSTGFKFDYAGVETGRLEVSVPNYLTSGRRLEGGFKRGTSQVLRTFGSTVASKVNSLTITGSTTLPLTLGWFFNLANYYYAGRFCELVWYNRGLNDSEINQIEGYLAWKWGLQKSLPSSHPFFNFPPG